MIISHDHKFIMLAPWKTASSTCYHRLRKYNQSPHGRFFNFNSHLNRVVHQHMTVSEFLGLPESRLEYFKGSFVRNPYDRAYSGFLQLQKAIEKQPRSEFPERWIRDLVISQLQRNRKRFVDAEYDFNKWITLLPEYEIYDVSCNISMPLHPAHYWTHHRGQQYVDFIGKLENFERDFAAFCLELKLDVAKDVNANINDPALIDIEGYRYISRMSPQAIDRINKLFAKDFELFGYEMIHPSTTD